MIRRLARAVLPLLYAMRTAGRMKGRRYIVRQRSKLEVAQGDRIVLGDRVLIDKDARIITRGGDIFIGDDVFIGKNVTLIAFSDLHIGARSLIGQNVSIHTENHGPAGDRGAYVSSPIVIGEDVWLAAGVVVTTGTTIAAGVTVGANSVVTKDLDPGTYGGVPAKRLRSAS